MVLVEGGMMINWFKSYLFIFLLSVLPITGCMTSAQWEEELFGPSEHEKLMAKLDRMEQY